MTVTRDVVIDLLPLYLGDEVSDDTRRLVEAFLAQDPHLARLARAGTVALGATPTVPVSPTAQGEALTHTRQLLARRQFVLAGAIALSLLPLSFGFAGDRVVWVLWQGYPGLAVGALALALICWVHFFRLRARLRVTGL